jgi:hypothetical protein
MIKKYWASLKEDKYKRHVALALFLFAIFLVLFTEPYFNTFNVVSRYLTIESIVEDGDFIVDDKRIATSDMIYREGHYYSSKPPVFSIMASSVYYITHNFFNQDFQEINDRSSGEEKMLFYYSIYPTIYITSLIFVGFTFWLMLLYFYKAMQLFSVKKKYYLPLILGLGLGTLFFSYSITFNNHTIGGSLLFIAFYYLLLIKKANYRPEKLNKYLSLAGLFASLSAVIDLPAGLAFYGLFFLYFFFKVGWRKIIYYVWPAIIIFSFHLYFNYQAFGGLWPAQAYKQYWIGPDGKAILSAWFEHHTWYVYIFNIFIGSHGLLLYTPILGISFYAMYKIIKEKHDFMWEALMVLFGFIIITLFYTIFARDYGGAAYGFRWYIAITPLIYFFTIFLCQNTFGKKLKLLFPILFIWSVAFAILGAYDPWPPGVDVVFYGQTFPLSPFIVILKLIQGSFLY